MAGNLPSAPNLNPDSNLARYLQDIRKFPLLEPEEEYMLAKRWKEHEDQEAAAKMVNSHLRLVAKIAWDIAAMACPRRNHLGRQRRPNASGETF